jgi:hypothetical protein
MTLSTSIISGTSLKIHHPIGQKPHFSLTCSIQRGKAINLDIITLDNNLLFNSSILQVPADTNSSKNQGRRKISNTLIIVGSILGLFGLIFGYGTVFGIGVLLLCIGLTVHPRRIKTTSGNQNHGNGATQENATDNQTNIGGFCLGFSLLCIVVGIICLISMSGDGSIAAAVLLGLSLVGLLIDLLISLIVVASGNDKHKDLARSALIIDAFAILIGLIVIVTSL